MNATYTIFFGDVELFNKLVANANKKAAKLGVPAYTTMTGAPRKVKFTDRGIERYHTMVDVTIVGETPKYAGWKLVGVITPLKVDSGEILPLVTTVPGETVLTGTERRDPLNCDHCKVRRDRNETFIVRHDDNTERQVGRSCLSDFLGDHRMSPAGLASLLNTLAGISNEVAKWSKGERKYDSESLTLVTACTLSVIRKNGWVSVTEARNSNGTKSPTRYYVQEVMHAVLTKPDGSNHDVLWAWEQTTSNLTDMLPTEEDFVKASEYINNASMILESKTEQNDYLDALRLLTSFNAVNRKALGIACSLVAFVNREMGIETNPLKAMLLKALKTSGFVGEIKKRRVFVATLVESKVCNGAYSSFILSSFVDANGNLIKVFGSVPFNLGETVEFKATPTRHDTYGETKSTVVNRLAKV
jgi:hypothetical protein